MCLGECEQVNEQGRGSEREEKESDHVCKTVCMREKKKARVRVCVHARTEEQRGDTSAWDCAQLRAWAKGREW